MQDGDAAETQSDGSEELENRVIAEIVELQREFYFENRNKDSSRQVGQRTGHQLCSPDDSHDA